MYGTLKGSQLISSSDNKKILLTTRIVRLDSGHYATKYYCCTAQTYFRTTVCRKSSATEIPTFNYTINLSMCKSTFLSKEYITYIYYDSKLLAFLIWRYIHLLSKHKVLGFIVFTFIYFYVLTIPSGQKYKFVKYVSV